MFRLLGFLLGSAASIGVMVWLLGVPRLDVGNPEPDIARFEEQSGKPGEGRREMSIPPQSAEVANPREAPEGTVPAAADAALPTVPGTAVTSNPSEPLAPDDFLTTNPPDAVNAGEQAQPLPEQRWHVFWSPFRSEIAARGFVARLESVTSVDYRIAKVKTGVYQVSFAYGSDAELDSNLSQIRAATGLDLHRR
jgi:hypothetical protein